MDVCDRSFRGNAKRSRFLFFLLLFAGVTTSATTYDEKANHSPAPVAVKTFSTETAARDDEAGSARDIELLPARHCSGLGREKPLRRLYNR